jgi:hypothetical protein
VSAGAVDGDIKGIGKGIRVGEAGGLIGSAVLGVIFDMFGWTACVCGIAYGSSWRR